MMIPTSIIRLLLLQMCLLLLLTSYSNAAVVRETTATEPNDMSSSSADAYADVAVEFELPELEVQFICPHDIRQSFNISDTFNGLYKKLLPDLQDTRLTFHERVNGMDDIKSKKWYYSECNMTSSQVLATMRVEGFAEFDSSTNRTHVNHLFNEETIREYFEVNVCLDLFNYRAYVENSKSSHRNPGSSFDKVEHSLILLCGGDDIVYYEEDAPDAGFLFFGFFAGFLMVAMVATELQKYDMRPHPLGSRPGRRNEYDGVTGQELEMV